MYIYVYMLLDRGEQYWRDIIQDVASPPLNRITLTSCAIFDGQQAVSHSTFYFDGPEYLGHKKRPATTLLAPNDCRPEVRCAGANARLRVEGLAARRWPGFGNQGLGSLSRNVRLKDLLGPVMTVRRTKKKVKSSGEGVSVLAAEGGGGTTVATSFRGYPPISETLNPETRNPKP